MNNPERARELLKTRYKDIKGINGFLDNIANDEPVLSGDWSIDIDKWLTKLEGRVKNEEKRG